MIRLEVLDNDRKHVVVRGDEAFCVEVSGDSFTATVYGGASIGTEQDPIGRLESSNADHVGWTWKGEDVLRRRIARGKEQLKELLLEAAKAGGADVDDVTVYYWSWNLAGLRIAEISFFAAPPPGGGICRAASYMQYDPGHESLLLMCERFVLDWAMGTENGGLPDVWRHRIKKYFAGNTQPVTAEPEMELSDLDRARRHLLRRAITPAMAEDPPLKVSDEVANALREHGTPGEGTAWMTRETDGGET